MRLVCDVEAVLAPSYVHCLRRAPNRQQCHRDVPKDGYIKADFRRTPVIHYVFLPVGWMAEESPGEPLHGGPPTPSVPALNDVSPPSNHEFA
jgi:hypothetical protein